MLEGAVNLFGGGLKRTVPALLVVSGGSLLFSVPFRYLDFPWLSWVIAGGGAAAVLLLWRWVVKSCCGSQRFKLNVMRSSLSLYFSVLAGFVVARALPAVVQLTSTHSIALTPDFLMIGGLACMLLPHVLYLEAESLEAPVLDAPHKDS